MPKALAVVFAAFGGPCAGTLSKMIFIAAGNPSGLQMHGCGSELGDAEYSVTGRSFACYVKIVRCQCGVSSSV